MHASHTDWGKTCLEQVVPVNSGKAGAIALAHQLEDATQKWRPLVLLLSKQGDAIAGSDWLHMETRGNGAGLVVTGARAALVVITERANEPPIVQVPVWYGVTWRGSRIQVEEIARWSNVSLGLEIDGAAVDGGTFWAGAYCPASTTSPGGYRDTRLLLAQSRGGPPSEPRLTDIECVHVSDPIPFGDEVYLLVTARFERAKENRNGDILSPHAGRSEADGARTGCVPERFINATLAGAVIREETLTFFNDRLKDVDLDALHLRVMKFMRQTRPGENPEVEEIERGVGKGV